MMMTMMVMMMAMVMTMMSKNYLKWIRKAKQFDDKERKVLKFRRGYRVVLAHHLS